MDRGRALEHRHGRCVIAAESEHGGHRVEAFGEQEIAGAEHAKPGGHGLLRERLRFVHLVNVAKEHGQVIRRFCVIQRVASKGRLSDLERLPQVLLAIGKVPRCVIQKAELIQAPARLTW